jgi:ABC-type dipeptide/oligopeptide/nickel transport system permease component
MLRYVVRRMILMVIVLLALTLVTFLMVQVIPGDPALTAAGRTATPEQVEEARIRLGLDKPLYVQYASYMGRLFQGDLGRSVFTHRPIIDDLLAVLPSSFELVLAAMLVNTAIAIPLGTLAAYYRGGAPDAVARLIVMLGVAVPVFWLGLLLQIVLGSQLGWFPISGQVRFGVDTGERITGMLLVDTLIQGRWEAFGSAVHHIVLPAIALAAAHIAVITRTIRSTMITALNQDFVTLARAKGMSEWRVVLRHALPNAIVPSVTILGMQVGWMLGYTVLVENIFGRAGIGSYAVTSVLQADLLAVIAVVLIIGVVFVVMNFLVDLAQMGLNPRLRQSATA